MSYTGSETAFCYLVHALANVPLLVCVYSTYRTLPKGPRTRAFWLLTVSSGAFHSACTSPELSCSRGTEWRHHESYFTEENVNLCYVAFQNRFCFVCYQLTHKVSITPYVVLGDLLWKRVNIPRSWCPGAQDGRPADPWRVSWAAGKPASQMGNTRSAFHKHHPRAWRLTGFFGIQFRFYRAIKWWRQIEKLSKTICPYVCLHFREISMAYYSTEYISQTKLSYNGIYSQWLKKAKHQKQ